jgi:hypothetical protein
MGFRISACPATGLLFLLLVTSVKADVIPPCVLPDQVTAVSLEFAPPALMQALAARVGEIVAPNERFDTTDVMVTGRDRRFIFIWNIGKRWVVATEHGGRGYNDPIFAYDLGKDSAAALVKEQIAHPDTVCMVASDLMHLP